MFNQFSLNAMAKSCEQVLVDTEVDFNLHLMRGPEHVLTDVVEHPHIAVLVLRRLCDDLFYITNQNWNNIFNYSIYSFLVFFISLTLPITTGTIYIYVEILCTQTTTS